MLIIPAIGATEAQQALNTVPKWRPSFQSIQICTDHKLSAGDLCTVMNIHSTVPQYQTLRLNSSWIRNKQLSDQYLRIGFLVISLLETVSRNQESEYFWPITAEPSRVPERPIQSSHPELNVNSLKISDRPATIRALRSAMLLFVDGSILSLPEFCVHTAIDIASPHKS
jgi:hypothetical protein